MTVQSTVSTQLFTGDGISKSFAFTFKFEDKAHIYARYVLTGTAYTNLVQGPDYLVSNPGPTGTVTTTTAVPAGVTLQVYRVVPLTQLTDLVTNDDFPAESVETRFDLITEQIQQINDQLSGATPSGGGGSTTIINNLGLADIVNDGGATGVYSSTINNIAHLRSLVAGTNVSLAVVGSTIQISAATSLTGALLAANNLSDVTNNQTARNTLLGAGTSGYVMTYNGTNWAAAPSATGSSGEANTMSNLGSGSQIYKQKIGVDLQVRSLVAGTGITLTQNANDITIAQSASSGEANTASNIGVTGTGLFSAKVGVDLRFKGLAGGLGISVANNGTDVTHAVNTAAALTWTTKQKFTGGSADAPIIPFYVVTPTADSPSVSHTRTSPNTVSGIDTIGIAHYIGVKAQSNSRAFEWAQLIVLDNFNDQYNIDRGAGVLYSTQNVGTTVKAYKRSSGQTWGAVLECQDASGIAASTLFGLEIDCLTNTNASGGHRRGIALYYGNTTVGTPASGNTLWDIGLEMFPNQVGNARMDIGISLGGTYLSAAIAIGGLTTLQNTPVAIDMAGGAALKFRSGAVASPTPTWYYGAFSPSYTAAIRILVDGLTFYLPVCSNHP